MTRKSPKPLPPFLKTKPTLNDAVAGVIVVMTYLAIPPGKDAVKIVAKLLTCVKELSGMYMPARRRERVMSALVHDPGFRRTMEDLGGGNISAQVFCNRIDRHMVTVRALARGRGLLSQRRAPIPGPKPRKGPQGERQLLDAYRKAVLQNTEQPMRGKWEKDSASMDAEVLRYNVTDA